MFHAARVGLGALGVVSTVTLQGVPAFNLPWSRSRMRVDEVLATSTTMSTATITSSSSGFPHTGWALTKTNNRTQEVLAPRGAVAEWRDDILRATSPSVRCAASALRPR